ncbi:MAG: amidohydrolase family protein [Burkholderiaceae bacterium]
MHDTVIKDAVIVDGTGSAPVNGDLAISQGKIVAIGSDLGAARNVVDAGGLALMPGIIDGHTHLDAQLTWDPFADPCTSLGVTSVVIGNCGFTIAPCKPADRDLTMRNLTQVEGMPLEALRAGIRWEFETFPQYLAMLEQVGVGPNVASFAGHSSIRTYVMGEEASQRTATPEELDRMAQLVREAMAAGAVGFSTTIAKNHNGDGGHPMPSRLAGFDEMQALAEAMGSAGRGVFMITRGSGATVSVSQVAQFTESCGRPVLIAGFLYNPAYPDGHLKDLSEVAEARAAGRRIWGEVSCCPLTMDFTLEFPYFLEAYSAWKPAMKVKGAALKELYRDTAFREAMKRDLDAMRGSLAFSSQWDKVLVVEAALPRNAALEGRSIQSIASERGVHPLDCFLDLGIAEDLRTTFVVHLQNADEEAVAPLLTDRNNYISLSDAGAHTSLFCDAGFGLHLLGHWVREKGVMTLQEAAFRLTGQPASIFGFPGRGRLLPGYAADLLLFDPATVGRAPSRRVRDFPGAASRLTSSPTGVHGVWVNGRQIADGRGVRQDAARAGQIIRSFTH